MTRIVLVFLLLLLYGCADNDMPYNPAVPAIPPNCEWGYVNQIIAGETYTVAYFYSDEEGNVFYKAWIPASDYSATVETSKGERFRMREAGRWKIVALPDYPVTAFDWSGYVATRNENWEEMYGGN